MTGTPTKQQAGVVETKYGPSPTRTALGAVTATLALALTVFLGWGIVDFATGHYIEGEVLAVQVILTLTGALALLAWAGAIALMKSARRRLRRRRRCAIGLVLTLVFFAAVVLSIDSMLAGGAVVLIGPAVILAGAIRL